MSEYEFAPAEELTYCEVHPDRETGLRCNRCNRLMCAQCAVQTPVGYRCKECVRQHEDKFFAGTNLDYAIVLAVAAVIGGLGFFFTSLLGGFLLFIIILAIPIGGAVGELALRLTGRRRGRYSGYVAAGGVVLGTLLVSFLMFGALLPPGGILLRLVAYAAIVASTAYGRFRLSI
jgi:hypothetical protein